MARIREKLTYANVMVTVLALAAVSSGTAYAVTKLDANSVTSKTIVDGAVRPVDLSQPTLMFDEKTVISASALTDSAVLGHLGDYKVQLLCDGLENAAFFKVAVVSGRAAQALVGGADQVHGNVPRAISYAQDIGGTTGFATVYTVPFNDPENFEPADSVGDIQVILRGGKGAPAVLHLHLSTHEASSTGVCRATGSFTGRA